VLRFSGTAQLAPGETDPGDQKEAAGDSGWCSGQGAGCARQDSVDTRVSVFASLFTKRMLQLRCAANIFWLPATTILSSLYRNRDFTVL
jgi:hypothetical protein